MAPADVSALQQIADSGTVVIRSTDSDFAATRREAVWNGSITRLPSAIVQPATTQQVADTVKALRSAGCDFTVRGGGHGFAGNAVAEGAVMLDLSRLGGVAVYPSSRRVLVGGGAKWADVDAATAPYGLALAGGMISHTGVAGLTLGGGIGWLSSQQGLTCDNLIGARLVTADGELVRAAEDENPDLLWALRGAGTNFGVVTEFEFNLHPASPTVQLGLFFWPTTAAKAPLTVAGQLLHSLLVRGFGAFVAGLSAPPAPFVPEQFVGRPCFAIAVVSWGDAARHAGAVAPLRDLRPAFELVTPMPYVALQQMFDESAPWGALGYEKALYLDDLTAVVDVMVDRTPRVASPLSFTPIFPLGGQFARVADQATSFGGSRDARWVFNISATAVDAASFDADRQWCRDYWEALRPHALGAGTYVNFLAEADEDRVRQSYGAKYDRLAKLKARWDPDNVFRHNANIRPQIQLPGQRRVDVTERRARTET